MSMPSCPLARCVAVVWLAGHLPSQLLLGCRPGNMRGGVSIKYSVVSDKIKHPDGECVAIVVKNCQVNCICTRIAQTYKCTTLIWVQVYCDIWHSEL